MSFVHNMSFISMNEAAPEKKVEKDDKDRINYRKMYINVDQIENEEN